MSLDLFILNLLPDHYRSNRLFRVVRAHPGTARVGHVVLVDATRYEVTEVEGADGAHFLTLTIRHMGQGGRIPTSSATAGWYTTRKSALEADGRNPNGEEKS